jgi:nicotinamide mononucleotide transporter
LIKYINKLETVAVISGLLYTYLIIEGSELCWPFALISSALYLKICFQKKIYAESLLQIFYLFTAVYGWVHWNETDGALGENLPKTLHFTIVLSGIGIMIVSGFLLKRVTDAASPFIDSFTTVFSIFATILMINLIPENWLYWIVIDAVSIYLYIKRKLYLTAILFALYTILAIRGTIEWMG